VCEGGDLGKIFFLDTGMYVSLFQESPWFLATFFGSHFM
jgi:hypothetical protein